MRWTWTGWVLDCIRDRAPTVHTLQRLYEVNPDFYRAALKAWKLETQLRNRLRFREQREEVEDALEEVKENLAWLASARKFLEDVP